MYLGEAIIGQGREAARAALDENHKLAKQIEDAIRKIVKEGKKALPKQVGETETDDEKE